MNAPLKQHLIDPAICIRCNTCESTCPVGAITHDAKLAILVTLELPPGTTADQAFDDIGRAGGRSQSPLTRFLTILSESYCASLGTKQLGTSATFKR